MSLEHVIKYLPCDCSNVVFIHHGRLAPGNVDLQPEKYANLKRNWQERTDAMTEYASQTDICRQTYLLKYFGQEDSTPCGTCDVCRAGRGNGCGNDAARKKLEAFLEGHPDASPADVKSFCSNPANGMPENAMSIYRKLLDEI